MSINAGNPKASGPPAKLIDPAPSGDPLAAVGELCEEGLACMARLQADQQSLHRAVNDLRMALDGVPQRPEVLAPKPKAVFGPKPRAIPGREVTKERHFEVSGPDDEPDAVSAMHIAAFGDEPSKNIEAPAPTDEPTIESLLAEAEATLNPMAPSGGPRVA